MLRYRFFILLVAMILLMAITPALHMFESEAHIALRRVVVEILFAAMLLAAIFAVSHSRSAVIIAWVLVTLTIILQVLSLVYEQDSIFLAHNFLGILFLCYTIAHIIRYLFVSEHVTFDMICASLCVYLLMGLMWAFAYSMLDTWDHDAFAYAFADNGETRVMRFSSEPSNVALYYSFVTLTTLGYGDITPVSPIARVLAAAEAFLGQLYLVVLVARLVGLHISQSTSAQSGKEGKAL